MNDSELHRHLMTLSRRRVMRGLVGASTLGWLGCTARASPTSTSALENGDGTCNPIPEEIAGPFPADGTTGPNALAMAGIVRSDIRSSFGGRGGVATGVPLTISLRLVDKACDPLVGRAIYVWHCDSNGRYSLYMLDENYLRGLQETNASGKVTFTSIFPAAYGGRWPHIHVEVFPNIVSATRSDGLLATSQIALPEDACGAVYATPGYEVSAQAFGKTTLASDTVFDDGATRQLASVSGNVSSGLVAELTIAV
jgi:protocatechuate 3,4-dioxygenase beta subunit